MGSSPAMLRSPLLMVFVNEVKSSHALITRFCQFWPGNSKSYVNATTMIASNRWFPFKCPCLGYFPLPWLLEPNIAWLKHIHWMGSFQGPNSWPLFKMDRFCLKPCRNTTGWWFEPLWKILVSWDDYPIYYGTKKWLKPPTKLSWTSYCITFCRASQVAIPCTAMVYILGSAVQLTDAYIYTIWLFNIAMENHNF